MLPPNLPRNWSQSYQRDEVEAKLVSPLIGFELVEQECIHAPIGILAIASPGILSFACVPVCVTVLLQIGWQSSSLY